MSDHLNVFIETGLRAGASDVRLLRPDLIEVDERLVQYCVTPSCRHYGRSANCPPHVEGPEQFRRWREAAEGGVAVRIEVEARTLFAQDQAAYLRDLHRIVAKIELQAVNLRYIRSRAFAGGSCKDLFCSEEAECLRLSPAGTCRHPLVARPSLSGFGVNVGKIMAVAGWDDTMVTREIAPPEEMSWIAGLVLLIR